VTDGGAEAALVIGPGAGREAATVALPVIDRARQAVILV
jgi:hypothetical protein